MNLIKLSKKMSYVLRHAPESVGLALDEFGRISLNAFCGALGVSEGEVRAVVANDSKQRFCLSHGMIWAAQGHTIEITPILNDYQPQNILYHGTKTDFLPEIFKNGLQKMSRNFVHLSETLETAEKVASRRNGKSVILQVDAVKMAAEGYIFKISSNGVVLIKEVPARFLKILG